MYLKYIKRLIDLLLSLIILFSLSWLFIIIAMVIKLTSRGNIIYKQRRVGIHKSEFYIFKFRTMNIDTPGDVPTHLLNNPDRYLTKIGKLLRKSSLDELPQLFNIIKGDMSLVGPRPSLWNQYDLIEEREKYNANSIRPGLTGWAQINGRDELSINLKAYYDGEYLKRVNFTFDALCLFKTILCIIKREGIKEGSWSNN